MKMYRYFSMLAAMVSILFLAAASTPTTSYAVTLNCQPVKTKAVKAKEAKKSVARYARVSNSRYKRQVAQNQSNTLQKPICVQCSTGYAPNWGGVAAWGTGKGQQTNPPAICSTCVPAWSLPATAARAPAKTTPRYQTNATAPVCTTCAPCGYVATDCYWNTPATAGASPTYTAPPPPAAPPAPAARTTTTARAWNTCGGLIGSILRVPYNIGAFVFGGCPISGCG